MRALAGVRTLDQVRVAQELYRDHFRDSAGLPGRVRDGHAEVMVGSYWGVTAVYPAGPCFAYRRSMFCISA